MSNLAQFAFADHQVRVILIDDRPWFVAVDICKVLDLENSSRAIARLKDYEKGVTTILTRGGKQDVAIISESGLYRLILTSRKPQAEPFQDWVCQEVLPQIRKTGKYEPQPTLNIYARRVQIASKWDIPKGHWCVFHEISLLANKVGETYQVGEYDLIDGSVGKCWSNYRKAFDWIQPTIMFPIFFGDSRDAARIVVHGYQNIELPHFRDWLENVYTLERLPKYLTGKYGQLMKRD
jgi:prophage antirepressor-like protein